MRKRLLSAVSSVVFVVAAASAARADTIVTYINPNTFGGNDIVHWNSLGVNTTVPNNFTVISDGGLSVMGIFEQGGSGSTTVECPPPISESCFAGNFSPGSVLLDTNSPGQGPVDLAFNLPMGIYGVGFQIQSAAYGPFEAELQAFDGATVLSTFFLTGNSNAEENNTAIFLGLKDLTGPNITSIKYTTFNCSGPDCRSFYSNWLALQTTATSSVPEPGTLMLLSSGLGILGFLRRKLA